jgi:hypothetical protein
MKVSLDFARNFPCLCPIALGYEGGAMAVSAMRALYKRAEYLVNRYDPLIGVYSEGAVLTIAVPTREPRQSYVRYRIHTLSGVDVRRDPPRMVAQRMREIVGKRPLRCAAAMDPSGIFMGALSMDGTTGSQALSSSPELVIRRMAAPASGAIAAKASIVRRWKTITLFARLDLDVLTAGPVALLNGLAITRGVRPDSFGALVIRYADTYHLCLCRGGVVLASSVRREDEISSSSSLLREWEQEFRCPISWGVVMGSPENGRCAARKMLEGVLSHSTISVRSLFSQLVMKEEPDITSLDEVSIASSIGLASLGCGV